MSEMPLSERSPGSGLQVPLEATCRLFIREFEGHHDGPWSVLDGVGVLAGVVAFEPSLEVRGQADVMPVWISLAAENVDDALGTALHVLGNCTARANVRGTPVTTNSGT